MKSITAAASTAFQLIYVLALLDAITSVAKILHVESVYRTGDPKMMAGALSTIIMNLFLGAIVAIPGVFLAWHVLRNKTDHPSWFLPVSSFFAWAWIPFIPVGTVIGVFMLRWIRPVTAKTDDGGQ